MPENDGGIGVERDCKLPNCENVLERDAPTRGIWANVCQPCRRGETPAGVIYREGRGIGAGGSVRPKAPQVKGTLEAKAKAIVPLAKKLEQKVLASKAAKADASASVTLFSGALKDLRDAAMALIDGGAEDAE